ncbi:41106_t:CDS:2, partial [Gigaspora margarita]
MEQYDGNEMENVIPPERLEIWDTRHVLVIHNEAYFYANNDNSFVWARVIIKPGQQADGYWKSKNIVQQLHEKAIPIFNAFHPGCIGISTNYNAYALDALMCSRMTLYPKVEDKFKFKDSWYIRNYEKITQSIFFLDENDGPVKFKGIKKILEERNMWTGQRLNCRKKKDDEK